MIRLERKKNNNIYFVYFLILINIVIFLFINEKSINTEALNLQYGLNSYTISNPFNYITTAFLHANYIHLGMNMFFMYIISKELLKYIDIALYSLLYLGSIIGSSLLSFLFISNNSELVNVVGASGGIFGLFAFFMLMTNQMKSLFIQFIIFHAIVFISNMPIAWYAHLGGALTGTLIYLILLKRK